MLKIRIICLFLSVCFASFSANAKTCFLPGVLADGCGDETLVIGKCIGFDKSDPCKSGYNEAKCVEDKETLYRCTCRTDNVKGADLGVKYTCKRSYDPECGCGVKDTECNRSIYKYTECKDGSVPGPDTCISPSTGKIYYKTCECPESIYPYKCKDDGLKPSPVADKCKTPEGTESYSHCDCDDAWDTQSCDKNTNGCTDTIETVFNGLGYCYYCGPATCSVPTDRNLLTVYCELSPTLVTDCLQLGYKLDTDGKCDDGTVGLKCAFGRNYIYCGNSGGGNGDSSTPVPYDKTNTVVATFSGGGSTTVINTIGRMYRMWVDGVEVTLKETIELASGTHEVAMEGMYGIPTNAFRDNTSLLAITIPESVTTISGNAFRGCTNLESVTIPGSVISIGSYAFYNCTSLESVTYLGTAAPATCSSSAFNGSASFEGVKVPQGYTSDTFCGKSVVRQ